MKDYTALIASKVIEIGDCLEWQGPMLKGPCKTPNAPVLGQSLNGKSVKLSVPRLVWEAAHGPIKAGKVVYRSCCNNRCVALPHLRVGTRADIKRIRKAAGLTAHAASTLAAITKGCRAKAGVVNDMDKAREVRRLIAEGLKEREICERTGMKRSSVSDIRGNRAWKESCVGASVFNMARAI